MEGAGSYSNISSTNSGISISTNDAIYTIMGGPTVTTNSEHLKPFVHGLFGIVLDRKIASVRPFDQRSAPPWTHNSGMFLGGGVDAPITRKAALRAQIDWLRYWGANLPSGDMIHASLGAVFRF